VPVTQSRLIDYKLFLCHLSMLLKERIYTIDECNIDHKMRLRYCRDINPLPAVTDETGVQKITKKKKKINSAYEHVHVATSGSWPKGHVPGAPNATTGALGPPNNPGSTPGSCPLTTPISSSFLGALVQYNVLGMSPPPTSMAFLGCARYLTALSISA